MAKFDIARLRQDIKDQALVCKEAKQHYKESQRKLDALPANASYQDQLKLSCKIGDARNVVLVAKEEMTKLCVFRASLRGRQHLSSSSNLHEWVDGWISEMSEKYEQPEAKAAG